MTRDEETELKRLQKECARSLSLYVDMAEAVCEILTHTTDAPLSPADRARVRTLHRGEVAALKAYLSARLRLMTALSFETVSEYRRLYNAVTTPERPRPRPHA